MTSTRQELAALLEERDINPSLHHGILAYVFDHQPVGHFLTAFFENNLFEALSRADEKSVKSLVPLMQIVYCYVDGRAHGSREKVKAWLDGSYAEPEAEGNYRCENCRAVFEREADMDPVEDIYDRVDPGEPMPAGQCPQCGALCHGT